MYIMRDTSNNLTGRKSWPSLLGIAALYGAGIMGMILVTIWVGSSTHRKSRLGTGADEVKIPVGKAIFVLVRIPSGEFEMGSPSTEKGHRANESPVRHVHISKPYYLGRFEVTQLQYKEVMGRNRFRFQGDSLPVQDIGYREALQFCAKLSERTGLLITLPTEAQWEYACRAGTRTSYYCG